MTGAVVVVGLGPAGSDLLLPAARTILGRIPRRFVRTARHPAVDELVRHGLDFTAFDELYERAPDLDTVYRSIVDTVVDAARAGDVVYAVPGNPGVAERTVSLLHDAARRGEIDLRVVPGLSFADLAWSRLGVDPMAGARVVDGRELGAGATAPGGPMLVAQVDSPFVLSDVKLVLLEALPPEHPVTVLQRLGLPDEQVRTVALADLDRNVAPDHLTSLFVDPGDAPVGSTFAALVALAERLRGPGGCPWDAEQTHRSLTRHLLEETYEVVEAVEALPPDAPGGEVDPQGDAYAHLEEELGDLLFQVVIHAVLAREAGAFDIAGVATGIHDKLVHRHPHVFGDVEVHGASDVVGNWERIKQVEKGRASLVEGISPALPALLYAMKLYRKASAVGIGEEDASQAIAHLDDALGRLRIDAAPTDAAPTDAALGDLLAGAVALARARGVDPEAALRGWAARFRDRFRTMEALATDRGIDLHTAAPGVAARLWDDAADVERAG